MTPAKLVACLIKRRSKLETEEMPIAQLAAMYYNSNRKRGENGEDLAEAPAKGPSDFSVFKTRSLAAKDSEDKPGGRHNLKGAKASRAAWGAWASGKTKSKQRVRTKKET